MSRLGAERDPIRHKETRKMLAHCFSESFHAVEQGTLHIPLQVFVYPYADSPSQMQPSRRSPNECFVHGLSR